MQKVLSIVGARPQFVKLAPVHHAFANRATHGVLHTGQHYDADMSQAFFDDLDIPAPLEHLAVGSASHGAQTGQMLEAVEAGLQMHQPDAVIVYGDTNSTLAGTLAAVKLGIPVAHVEAGLRSFNRTMPEEINRVATDHLADLCLAPTQAALGHLEAEGLAEKSVEIGDVMTDVLLATRARVGTDELDLPSAVRGRPFVLATLHRPYNTDDPQRLDSILRALDAMGMPVLLLAHPRLRACADRFGIALRRQNVAVAAPAPYPRLVALLLASSGVVTDSGGLQKEAFILRRPTVTVRSETEWTETVDLGWNTLVWEDPARIPSALGALARTQTTAEPYGDGCAAHRAVDAIVGMMESRS